MEVKQKRGKERESGKYGKRGKKVRGKEIESVLFSAAFYWMCTTLKSSCPILDCGLAAIALWGCGCGTKGFSLAIQEKEEEI